MMHFPEPNLLPPKGVAGQAVIYVSLGYLKYSQRSSMSQMQTDLLLQNNGNPN